MHKIPLSTTLGFQILSTRVTCVSTVSIPFNIEIGDTAHDFARAVR